MTKYIALFFMSLIFWIMLTWSLEPVSFGIGILVALFATAIFGKYFYTSFHKVIQIKRFFMVFPFLLFFVIECIKANFDVAWRVVQFKIPIKPAILKIPLSVETDLARAVLSCALTMTPGTIVVDIEGDDMYIHWVYIGDNDPYSFAKSKIYRFEKYIKAIFD